MNWKRIIIYVGILFLATAVAAFPFGFIVGFLQAAGKVAPLWITLGQAVAISLTSILVFAHLAKRQREKTFLHAWCVGIGAWLISFPINVLFLRQPILVWIAGIILIAVTLLIGVLIGSKLRCATPTDKV